MFGKEKIVETIFKLLSGDERIELGNSRAKLFAKNNYSRRISKAHKQISKKSEKLEIGSCIDSANPNVMFPPQKL